MKEEIKEEQLNKFVQEKLQQLKKLKVKTDCYSIKGNGGATKDCDVAIDVYNFKNEDVFENCTLQHNPYNEEEGHLFFNLTRLKFTV